MKNTAVSTTVLLIFVSLFLFSGVSKLYADLGDFSNDVKKDQQDGADGSSGSSQSSSDSDSALLELFLILWGFHNLSSWYTEYPYANNRQGINAIGHDMRLLESGSAHRLSLKQSKAAFYASGGGFLEGTDPGLITSLRMNTKFFAAFGLDAEYRFWHDSADSLHFYRGSFVLPLVQANIFSLDMLIGGAGFLDSFSLSGFSFGAVITSYPFQPVSLEFRSGLISSDSVTFGELGGKLGIHIRRAELFLEYYGLFHDVRNLQSLGIGIGYHL